MHQSEIEQFVTGLDDVERDHNLGYVFYYYKGWHMIPFVSIAENGNEYEAISRLDREGVFRVNIGVSKKTFDAMFPDVDLEKVDFTALDTFLPHPHYSKQSYICILNPSQKNEEQLINCGSALGSTQELRNAKQHKVKRY